MKPVINSSYCKKLQSQIKSVIQNFGKLIVLWKSDSSQVSGLLSELSNLFSEWMAVSLTNKHENGSRIVSGELMIEIELIFSQIKMFEKRLLDVVNAMSLAILEAFKLITNEPIEIFPVDSIFTTEHFLDMQTVYQNCSLELDNERVLLESLSELSSKQQTSSPHFGLSKEGLNCCIEQWSDESESSHLNNGAIAVFLSSNNLSSGS